jgi:hypothetical protein
MQNKEFLECLFGGDVDKVHVTDFTYDPYKIPQDKRLQCWFGKYFKDYNFTEGANQYFTISIFNPDGKGTPRRQKALFLRTRVIVLDDVREKLSMDEVKKLPDPSYILETSPGSEQWGYILDTPCEERSRVENLLDGLVANGLAPQGKDPGMKGVTRYVRLPGGYNTKESKMIDGKPFKCRLLEWSPFITVSMKELAKPFNVDLDQQRREGRLDGASNVPDHPLLDCGLNIKDVRSDGRFDITCPWVDEHTGGDDSGSAIFTNDDGSMGFKCHHGNCETKTGRDLMDHLDENKPGFKNLYKNWQFTHSIKDIVGSNAASNLDIESHITPVSSSNSIDTKPVESDNIIDILKRSTPGSPESREISAKFLKSVESLSEMDKHYHHQEVCDIMGWSQTVFAKILKDLREDWYAKKNASFYDNMIFIKEQNLFYEYTTKIFYTAEAFQNSFANEDIDARKEALSNNRVKKVDKMDFAPTKPRIFEENGVTYSNTWDSTHERKGVEGDCSKWLDHWDTLGWGENKKHMLQWMAFTILHPETKINHILLLGGAEGTGKDFILYPLIKAMGNHSETAEGHELLSSFADYILNYKHLHINETELGDHKDATTISNKLKPLAAAPPETLRVNIKNKTPIKVRNIVNLTMTTNSQMPIKLNGPSRRFYAVWSDFNQRDDNDVIQPEWLRYWDSNWAWMFKEGVDNCIWYLRNCVDLSDFNPGSPPPMTDFLTSIRESSKSPMQQTVEEFISNKIGVFEYDMLTTNEASTSIRTGAVMHEDITYAKSEWFTPVQVGRQFSIISKCVCLRMTDDDGKGVRVWVIRNKEVYEEMSMRDRFHAYNSMRK